MHEAEELPSSLPQHAPAREEVGFAAAQLPAAPVGVAVQPVRSTGSLSAHVRWSDGTAATHTGVFLEATGSWGSLRATTDDRGLARFDSVALGRYDLRGDRGGALSLRMGLEDLHVDLVIPQGRRVLVRVGEESGVPLAGAGVFLSLSQRSRASTLIGQTDVKGELALEHVEGGRFITARKHGYEPSPSIPVLDEYLAEGTRLDVCLQVGGATVRGRVTSAEDGAPLDEAHIQVLGGTRELLRPMSDGIVVLGDRPLPAETVTRADGEFKLENLHSGTLEIVVDCSEFVRYVGVVDISAGESRTIEVALSPALPLRGRVLDAHGVAVAEALVTAGDRTRDKSVYSLSGSDGTFALQGLTPGLHLVVARASRGRSARAEVTMPADGAELSLVLEGPDRATGRVVNAAGLPVADCYVTFDEGPPAPGPAPRSVPIARTDQEGWFWLTTEDDRDGWLYFWLARPSALFPSGVIQHRQGSPTTFVCPQEEADVAILRVGCTAELDQGMRPLVRLVQLPSEFEALAVTGATGLTEFSGLSPGRYVVHYCASLSDSRRGPTVDLGARETRTLPRLTAEEYRALPRAR